MSHLHTALLWQQLQKRRDIANVIWESFGELLSATIQGQPSVEKTVRKLFLLCKTVFSLERVYLQAKQSAPSSITFSLEPHTIADIIESLVTYATQHHTARVTDGDQYDCTFVHQLRQAVLSGVRCLSLAKCRVPPGDVTDWSALSGRLGTCFALWPQVEEIDQYLTRSLFDDCRIELSLSSKLKAAGACTVHPELDLARFGEASFIVANTNSIVECVEKATKCLDRNCPLMSTSFWTWSDARLALIAASIEFLQRRIVPVNGSESIVETEKPISALESSFSSTHLESTYSRIDGAMTTNGSDERIPTFVKYLTSIEPIPPCRKEQCKCLKCLEQQTGLDDDDLKEDYESLERYLEKRKQRLFDSNGALESLRQRMDAVLRKWTSAKEDLRPRSPGGPEHTERMAFVLSCSEMHPISYAALEALIKESPVEKGLDDLRSGKELINISVSCRDCKPAKDVYRARQVVPLYDIAAELTKHSTLDESEENERIESETKDNVLAEDLPKVARPSTPILNNRGSEGSSLSAPFSSNETHISSASESTSTTSSKKRLFPQWNTTPSLRPKVELSLSLGIDAGLIVAWSSHQASCYKISLLQWCPKTVTAPDIVLAAAGVNKFAVVSLEGSQYALSIYHSHSGEQFGGSIPFKERVYSMAFSRDSKQLAVGCSVHLYIIALQGEKRSNDRSFRQELPLPEKERAERPPIIGSQCISFSAGSSRVIVATWYRNTSKVRIGVYIDPAEKKLYKTFSRDLPLANRDFGLSSIVMHGETNKSSVILCASADKAHLRITNLDFDCNAADDDTITNGKGVLGDRIQVALQVPAPEARFVLVNDSNEVFTVQRPRRVWESQQLRLHSDIHRTAINDSREKMSAAATNEGVIKLLWLQNEQACIVKFERDKNVSEPPTFVSMTPFLAQHTLQ